MFPAISVSRLKISRGKQNNVIQWRREGCSASLCSNYSQNMNLTNSILTKECDCMENLIILIIIGIVLSLLLLGGLVYLYVLVVKALKKYINSGKTQKDK